MALRIKKWDGRQKGRKTILRDLMSQTGRDLVNHILSHKDPEELVRGMSQDDFFWVVKRLGEEDSLPLLSLASEEQWQYLLDLDLWDRDRINPIAGLRWVERLYGASPERLAGWALGEGAELVSHLLYHSLEVVALESKEEAFDLGDDFFTLDGVFYIRIMDAEYREVLVNLLRGMAEEDLRSYQGLLQSLCGYQASEREEEMYRFRKARIEAYGFVPQEEALSVYAPLDPDALTRGGDEGTSRLRVVALDEHDGMAVPLLPLGQTPPGNLLVQSVNGSRAPQLLERIRVEFAGLCNQILSAEDLKVEDFGDLIRACRRAASYINLGLERLGGKDLRRAEDLLRAHPLPSLFRVGFGLALKLKRETERWIRQSWFNRKGLDSEFWGEHWGGVLEGITGRRPQKYIGTTEPEGFGDFEWLSDMGEALEVLRHMMVMDGLLERLSEQFPMAGDLVREREWTFLHLLFNLWSRGVLSLEPGVQGIDREQARRFFALLRSGEEGPPYRMGRWKQVFVQEFMAHVSQADQEAKKILPQGLSAVWDEFVEEHEMVETEEIEGRYSRFLTIEPPSPPPE